MTAKNQERRRLTDKELENIKKDLLERKRQLWDEISDDIDEDVREEHQELIQMAKDGGDRGLAELRESTIFSLIELKVEEIETIEEALQRIEIGKYGRAAGIAVAGSDPLAFRFSHMPFAAAAVRKSRKKWNKYNPLRIRRK